MPGLLCTTALWWVDLSRTPVHKGLPVPEFAWGRQDHIRLQDDWLYSPSIPEVLINSFMITRRLCDVRSVSCFPYHLMHETTVLIGSDLISILVSRTLCTRQRFKRHIKLSVTPISPLKKHLSVWQDSKAEGKTGGDGMCINILKQARCM